MKKVAFINEWRFGLHKRFIYENKKEGDIRPSLANVTLASDPFPRREVNGEKLDQTLLGTDRFALLKEAIASFNVKVCLTVRFDSQFIRRVSKACSLNNVVFIVIESGFKNLVNVSVDTKYYTISRNAASVFLKKCPSIK